MQSVGWVGWAIAYGFGFAIVLIVSRHIPLLQRSLPLRFWITVILVGVFFLYQPGAPDMPFGWVLAGLVSGFVAWLTFKLWRWIGGVVSSRRPRAHVH